MAAAESAAAAAAAAAARAEAARTAACIPAAAGRAEGQWGGFGWTHWMKITMQGQFTDAKGGESWRGVGCKGGAEIGIVGTGPNRDAVGTERAGRRGPARRRVQMPDSEIIAQS